MSWEEEDAEKHEEDGEYWGDWGEGEDEEEDGEVWLGMGNYRV